MAQTTQDINQSQATSTEAPLNAPTRKRIWLRAALWIILTPIFLFTTLMVLLYVPPVQNFIRKQATSIASDATGWDISVERIDLRFPLNLLVRGVQVVAPADSARAQADTLLRLGSLNVSVQAMPLFKGRVEVDHVDLKQINVNSSNLVKGMRVQGALGNFHLQSHGIDLKNEEVILNRIDLADTHLQVMLNDTTQTPEDTTQTEVNWKIRLHDLTLKNISVGIDMPLDSLRLATNITEAQVQQASADLQHQFYGCRKFDLKQAAVKYDIGSGEAAPGLDANHLHLRNLNIGIDSVHYAGRNLNAVIRQLNLDDRSGLSVTSLTGRLFADSTQIRIPNLLLRTPHSEMNLSAQTYWKLIDIPTTGHLSARLNARIGKQDVMLLAGNLPESFQEAYPSHPLTIQAGTEGNLTQMQISRFQIDLPGAFNMEGGGEFYDLTDTLNRKGQMDFKVATQNLNFLTTLNGLKPDGSIVVPDSMLLEAQFGIEGQQCKGDLHLAEANGALHLNGTYHLSSEAYSADLVADSMQLHHFLPQDSIYLLTAQIKAYGQGTDFTSAHTTAHVDAALRNLEYKHLHISGVSMDAALKNSTVHARLHSDNQLLRMKANADMRLDRQYLDGGAEIEVDEVNLFQLGLIDAPLKHPFAFQVNATARHDSVKMQLNAGDLNLQFRAHSTLKQLMGQTDQFMALLMQQIDERHLNHAALRRLLPSAGMQFFAGKNNPLSDYLATKDMQFEQFKLGFGFTPELGINGSTAIHNLRVDSVRLDTLFFAIHQDTTRMQLQGGVINGPSNPQISFRSTLTGEIRNEDAELTLNYTDGQGRTGMLFGINARPLTEGHGKGNGVLFTVIPEKPVIAFRDFHFVDKQNWLYLHKNMRVYAGIDMDSEDGLCFSMKSSTTDTLSLQNINVELSRLNLQDLSEVIPYMPRLSGLFTVDANYVQTATSLQVSAEANIEELTYERQPVGDIGLGATWLPGKKGMHYLNTYLSYNNQEVLMADGTLHHNGTRDSLDVAGTFEHFPLQMANAFIPGGIASFTGDIDGEVYATGTTDKPQIEGSIALDSVSLYSKQAGARYWLDNRPLQIANNRLNFKKFSIYTTSKNPFTIDGNIDFRNLDKPTANLKLQASNYTLLDAPRTRESLLYGKIFVDIDATVHGPLESLTMRGNMNLLGNTNATYVLTDSPLTVEDRLDGLVTFTSFRDTAQVADKAPTMSLGGMQMYISMHIDDAVRLRADLSPDRSKYVELIGGGDLNMQYTPQGDISLVGRYTLTGGTMKYSLPVIPLKEFSFSQGSYVDWRGDIMNPTLNLKATERMRSSVDDGSGGSSSRMVNFNVSIGIKNKLTAPQLIFDLEAPEDATISNELQAMSTDERNKMAITMLATGIYMGNSGSSGGLTMSSALNSVLQSQINSLAGSAKNASISVGVEDRTSAETGDTQKDFSFRYSQRLFNDRVQIIIGGKVSTGANATNSAQSFIDNVSLEYRLDTQGSRYVRAFYNKNYESVLDGEITETGVGLVMRKKMDRLSELFIFRKKKKKPIENEDVENKEEESKAIQSKDAKNEEVKK